MNRYLFLMAFVVACSDDGGTDEGTVVGNPGDAKFRMAPIAGADLNRARTAIEEVVWAGCDDRDKVMVVQDEVDLLDDFSMPVPAGEWCGVWVGLTEPLELELYVFDWEKDLRAYLELEDLFLEAPDPFLAEQSEWVLEWGYENWLADQVAELEEWIEEDEPWREEDVLEITEEDPVHDDLSVVFMDGSALYEDGDGDGRINDTERNGGPIAAGSEHPQEPATDESGTADEVVSEDGVSMDRDAKLQAGSGCGRSDSQLNGAVLFPLMLLGFRRRFSRR